MNIHELATYNLSDAVKFHNRLNPRLWDQGEQLKPEVREKLLEIAADFQEFLGVGDLEVEDITISGSNAAYSYTPHSDIDLHLVVRQPQQDDEVYQELFNAKKYQYNDMHNIRVKGADVELYVQPADQKHVSLGVYSVLHDKWLDVPKRKRAKIDHVVVQHKYEDLKARIESALAEGDHERIEALTTKIKEMRQSGLDTHGEFGPENLAFKMLRTQGLIKQLWDAKAAAKDQALSLKERERQQARQPVTYGFKEDAGATPDGVNPTTCMFLNEEHDAESVVAEFIEHVAKRLQINNMPRIELHTDPAWSEDAHSFGRYEPDSHTLHVSLSNRHILDVLRTTAHELAHCKQNELATLPNDAGETGSDWENEAHAVAGILMRDFADTHPEYFNDAPLKEDASGYIPTKKQANDPRFKTALTIDIKPGEVGRQANKMGLQTDKQGKPALIMKSANLRESQLAERLRDELAALNQQQQKNKIHTNRSGDRIDGLGNQIPPGPEFKPTMPKGTVRVDVSDMYDWYKLGKNISNLKGADKSQFGKGPPSTIVSFGDENTEHKYINDLENLGLSTTDIDPVDPDQPPGMPRQKTDPTFNVDENKNQTELDPEIYGEELPLATVKQIVTDVVKQVDPQAKVKIKYDWGTYLVSSEKLRFDFGITADGGEISANIVNGYSSYKGAGVITKIIGECFKAAEQLWGTPTKFVISVQQDRGHGVWQAIAKKLGAEWGGSVMENFADGKKPGRKGLAKRSGVDCKQSVTKLRSIAAHSSGEKQRMAHWCANMKSGRQDESVVAEISRLPKSDAGDFGDKGTLANPTHPVKKKPLPGGSGFTYAVNRTGTGDLEIMIFDGETLAAELDLFDTQDVTGAWRVETVVTDPDYRGQGLGKALYGIALSILKLTIEAGDTQTRHGQQMWLMLNSIPGVEVQGYNQQRTSEYKPQRGDKIIDQNKDWTRYTFPVTSGSTSMRSGRRGTGIYTTQASMLAKWTGR